MNNRLKFRVWDFTIKRFDTQIYQAGEQFGHPSSCDWIAQQYTGLNDKDNNPIFEGDIIKEHHFEDWGDKIGYEYIGIVVYKEYSDDILYAGYKTIPAKNQNTKFRGNAIQSDCEVIGNIFENPELLK
jgi:uncharacterized phage protein (TIGR01671 family)